MTSRREFIELSSAAAAVAAALPRDATAGSVEGQGGFRGTLCLFSKPVPQLSWPELAQRVKAAGFGGVDLTVRTKGHVMPARAAEDLPKAVVAIRAAGLEVPMITTELLSGDHPTAEPIVRTAAKLSIPFLKPGYYYYKFVDVRRERDEAAEQFRSLVKLTSRYGVQVGFHNHAGYIGGQLWDMAPVIDALDARDAGFYYDLDNATMEGGVAGWKIGAKLAMARMKMMAVKDFYWKQTEKGWEPFNCPLGQGMCKHSELFRMAAAGGFHGPISLHMEFQIPGVSDDQGIALGREQDEQVMMAAERELRMLKSLLRTAYGEA